MTLIKRKDISEFFDLEAEESKKNWDALMNLSVADRVRKRKAIRDVFLNVEDKGMSPEDEYVYEISFKSNLSDFKEGERLLLHEEGCNTGLSCTLNSFIDDEHIQLSIHPYNMPSNIKIYDGKPLVLDKSNVDLREFVFNPFLSELPFEEKFWKENILNTKVTPTFENKEACEEELQDTINNFGLEFTPKQREAIVNCMSAKDYYLVQGPPGTGKSFVLGVIMLEELAYFNHKVVVIGPNHMAINNALEQMLKLAPLYDCLFKVGQSYNEAKLKVTVDDKEYGINNMQRINGYGAYSLEGVWTIGLTPHCLYTSRAKGLECDTLIIDEAGQMTIPLALMGMIRAKKVIFAGDHKQLPPIVTSEKVSADLKESAFQRLITDSNCTMLDVSFRMCEPICDYVSELFYEGKVTAQKKGCGDKVICNDQLYSFDTPIIIHNIDDDGEQTSDQEAMYITEIISEYVNNKGLEPNEIAVLAPFRAQAANIRRHLRKSEVLCKEQYTEIAVDTVDKMQGQEREIIIFSMTAGNPDYITDMADFLFNPNKLNVAFSRAKSKLIIVGNLKEIGNINVQDYPHIQKMLESKFAITL